MLIKTDSYGIQQWSKTYDIAHNDQAYSVIQTTDLGYLIAGSNDPQYGNPNDVLLIKTIVEKGLSWVDSTSDMITLYRGASDPYWNYVRVRIWKITGSP